MVLLRRLELRQELGLATVAGPGPVLGTQGGLCPSHVLLDNSPGRGHQRLSCCPQLQTDLKTQTWLEIFLPSHLFWPVDGHPVLCVGNLLESRPLL